MANTLNLGNGNWATKKDSLLGYNSENGNFKPLPFDFTRASSATVVNKDGLIETVSSGEPRIDFKGNTKGSLLLEPSRSNLVTYSEDTTEWDKNETPINTSNTTISPNGSQNADSVIVNSTSEGFYDFSVGTVQSGTSYTFSIFIKYISGIETIRFGGSGGGFGGDNNNVFNIKNGTVVSAASGNTLSVDDYGNGWYRLIATKTASSTATAAWILYGNENAEIQYSAWGVQLEQGSYATSYIPTSGSAVTRVADSCLKDDINTSIINSSYPFSMYAESTYIGGNNNVLSFSKKVVPNNYYVISITGNNQVLFDARANGISELIESGVTLVDGQKFKAAITMESATSGKICVNGNTVVSKTNFSNQAINNEINDLILGQLRTVNDTGKRLPLSDVKLYNTALTDQELIALTS